ncbi:MAG: amidohydrolase family protein [Oscillospiraceae bacterium]
MIIDAHAHVYPDKIAEKASGGVGSFYGLEMHIPGGTVDRLIGIGNEAGIDKFLIHSVATTPHQVESINNFIISSVNSYPDRFIGFATGHPDYAEPEKELERVIAAGLHGVKLHPDFQQFVIDDRRMWPLYSYCEENCIPILFHTGDPRFEYSNPRLVPRLLERFPELKLICAHFGGWSEWDEAAEFIPGTGVKVDCSSSFYAMTDERIMEFIEIFGEDNIFFGSDYPMWNPKSELERFLSLPLSADTQEKILSGNLIKFLELDI